MSGVWIWFPAVGPIRLSTVLGAVIMFGAVSVARRDVLAGAVAFLTWTSLFETIFGWIGFVVYHSPLGPLIWVTAALAGWVILGWKMNIRPDWRLSLVFALTMAVWIAAGFHSNVAGHANPINVRDEVLNEVAKSSLGLAYLVGSLRASPLQKKTGPAVPTPSLLTDP